jgi:hypothetical protein
MAGKNEPTIADVLKAIATQGKSIDRIDKRLGKIEGDIAKIGKWVSFNNELPKFTSSKPRAMRTAGKK